MDRSVITFLLGAALASGIFYVGTRKSTPPPVEANDSPTTTSSSNSSARPTVVDDGKPSPVVATDTTPIVSTPAPVVTPQPAPIDVLQSPVQTTTSMKRRSSEVEQPVKHRDTAQVKKQQQQQPRQVAQAMPPATPMPANTAPAYVPPAPAYVPAPEPPRPAVTNNNVPETRYEPTPPPPPKPNSVTIAAGTSLSVRLGQSISTETNHAGDTFTGSLDQPLIINGFVIAERGSHVEGRVVEADKGGRVEGLAELKLELTRINTSDGQRVRVATEAFARQAQSAKKEDAAKIGGGAALGAIIGAIAGGGKGAAIGAGAGGAGGTGVVLGTRGKQVNLPVETRMSFRLREPVTLTEQLH